MTATNQSAGLAILAGLDEDFPEGYSRVIGAGWTVLTQETPETVPSVHIGPATYPQRFELVVRSDSETNALPDFLCILMFKLSEGTGELSLTGVISPTHDVDQALSRLRTMHPIEWWKRQAFLMLLGLKSVMASAAISDLFMKYLGADFSQREAADEAWVKERLASSKSVYSRRNSRVTDSLLREVADTYRAALDDGENPTQSVAEHFYKSHSTAARWVGMARQRGFLEPASGKKPQA